MWGFFLSSSLKHNAELTYLVAVMVLLERHLREDCKGRRRCCRDAPIKSTPDNGSSKQDLHPQAEVELQAGIICHVWRSLLTGAPSSLILTMADPRRWDHYLRGGIINEWQCCAWREWLACFLLLRTNWQWQQRRVPFLCSHHLRIVIIPSYLVAPFMVASNQILWKERILLVAAVG